MWFFLALQSVGKVAINDLYGTETGTICESYNALELLLTRAFLNYQAEKDFFQTFSSLRRIYYGRSSEYGIREDPIYPKFLDHLKYSLEEFVFSSESRYPHSYEAEGAFEKLFEFSRLTKLGIPIGSLLGRENGDEKHKTFSATQINKLVMTLPVSLKSLALLSCVPSVYDYVEVLFPATSPTLDKQSLPNLEEVVINFIQDELAPANDHASVDWEYWVQRARENGVRLLRLPDGISLLEFGWWRFSC